MNENGFQINEICRGCLSDEKGSLRPIEEIEPVFSVCIQKEILLDDGLSTKICNSCVYKCFAWQTFKQQCENSEQILREKLTIEEKETNLLIDIIDTESNVIAENESSTKCIQHEMLTSKEFHQSRDEFESNICSEAIKCNECGKEFSNLRALRCHRTKHTDGKSHKCGECGKTYKYITSLALHKKVHQNIRKYVCDLCGKSFTRAYGLQSHSLTHSTETPFECSLCHKQFKNQIMLNNHQMRHVGVKNFICTDCGKAFTTKTELDTHRRLHTGEKPFECDVCSKSYRTKSHLIVHYRTHTGQRPYACDLCPMKFAHGPVSINTGKSFESSFSFIFHFFRY